MVLIGRVFGGIVLVLVVLALRNSWAITGGLPFYPFCMVTRKNKYFWWLWQRVPFEVCSDAKPWPEWMDPSPGSLGDRGLGWDWVESTFNKTDNLKLKAEAPREARWITLWPNLWFRASVTHQESFPESWEPRELVFQVSFLLFSSLQGASFSSSSPSFLHHLCLFLLQWYGWNNLVILLHALAFPRK